MQYQRDWRAGLLGVVVAPLQPTVWAGKHHLWHGVPKSVCLNMPGDCPYGRPLDTRSSPVINDRNPFTLRPTGFSQNQKHSSPNRVPVQFLTVWVGISSFRATAAKWTASSG